MNKKDVFPQNPSLFQRIHHSIFPGPVRSAGEKARLRRWFNSLILHFRPRTVPEQTLRLTLSWGLGGMAVVLIGLLFGTGMLLKFYYEPFPAKAYDSIIFLQEHVLFGKLVRNIHHWSGHGLLIVVFLHFLRVFFTGAFYPPRQFNWVIGLALFMAVFFANFTGYLMPWDQLAFWAVTISAGMLEYVPVVGEGLKHWVLGGSEMGPATLTNFYAIHTAVLPALFLFLLPFHFWRVRKAGGLVLPHDLKESPPGRGESVEAMPNLIVREVVVALVLMALILIVAIIFNAPLGSKANPGFSPNPTKAPWYFAGFQEMLMHFHPFFALFMMPFLLLVSLLLIPYFKYTSDPSGVWFRSSKGRKAALVAVMTGLLMAPIWIIADEYLFQSNPSSYIGTLIAFGGICFVVLAFNLVTKKKFGLNRHESIQAVFVLLLTVFLFFMLINIWFRGAGMQLMWPWQVLIKGL